MYLQIDELIRFVEANFDIIFKIAIFPGIAFIFGFLIFAVWYERKFLARLMVRMGPVHAGKVMGWLQLIADAIKLITKEFIVPRFTLRSLFFLLPILLPVIPAAMVVLIPFGPGFILYNAMGNGLILFLALSTIYPVLNMLTGWVSNNKFTIIGAFRTIYLDVAAEIPLILSIIGVVIMAGTYDLVGIVEAQSNMWFIIPQILGFIVFFIGYLGMTERVPMDFPVAEVELVFGIKTEYSGPLYLLLMEADYVNWLAWSLLMVVLYLGGYNGPNILGNPVYSGIFWTLFKLLIVLTIVLIIKIGYARLRVDQAVRMGWKYLIPLAVINLVLTILIKYILNIYQ